MRNRKSWRGLWAFPVFALLACSGLGHDCFEARDCPGPKGFIEAGADEDWWSAGAGGQAEIFDPDPDPARGAGSAGDAAARKITEGGAGGAADAGSDTDGEQARILRVTPVDGASGVPGNAEIMIYFSQPVNEASVEAAYHSNDLAPSQLSFTWDPSATTLTLTPSAPLLYAAGAALADGSVAFDAKTYRFGFGVGATDSRGQPLPEADFSFSTLRRASFVLGNDPQLTGNWTDGEGEGVHNCLRGAKAPYAPSVCIGDDAQNVRYTGFLSFDLSPLPRGIVEVSSARLQVAAVVYGAPRSLGDSRLEQVSFAELGDEAVHTVALDSLGPFLSDSNLSNESNLVLSVDLTLAVADDYAKRVARSNRSQYRLSFAQINPDGIWDDIELLSSNVRLATTFLVP